MNADYLKLDSNFEADGFDLDVCRTCLVPSASVPLFSEIDEDIGIMLVAIGGVAVAAGDGLPTAVCEPCAGSLRAAYAFRLRARQSNRTLRNSRLVNSHSEPSIISTKQKKQAEEKNTIYQHQQKIEVEIKKEPVEISTYQDCMQYKSADEIKQEKKEYHEYVGNEDHEPEQIVVTPKIEVYMPEQLMEPAPNMTHQPMETKQKNEKYLYKVKKLSGGFKCETLVEGVQCGVVQMSKRALASHQRTHAAACSASGPLMCNDCGQGFASKHRLQVHIRQHSRKYSFYCPECNKGCSEMKALKLHLRVHTGERPFTCMECYQTFSVHHNMQDHIKRVHQRVKKTLARKAKKPCKDRTRARRGKKPTSSSSKDGNTSHTKPDTFVKSDNIKKYRNKNKN